MVTATTGNIQFQGVSSGRIYSYSLYISDVDAAFATFSAVGPAGTGSTNFISLPEDCVLIDISTLLAPTVAVTVQVILNDMPTGIIIQDAVTLYSVQSRSIPKVRLKAGKFQLLQK